MVRRSVPGGCAGTCAAATLTNPPEWLKPSSSKDGFNHQGGAPGQKMHRRTSCAPPKAFRMQFLLEVERQRQKWSNRFVAAFFLCEVAFVLWLALSCANETV